MTGPARAAGAADPMSVGEAGTYQRLRAHLAYLRLPDAAAALPGLLDQARDHQLGLTAALERLLAVEVDAVEARRQAGRLRFSSLPQPWTLAQFDFAAQPGVDEAAALPPGPHRRPAPRGHLMSTRPGPLDLGPLEREPVNLRPPFEIRVPLPDPPPRRRGADTDIAFGTWRAAQLADRVAALREPLTGLALGAHDRRILDWLAGWDVPTIGGVASLLHRARAATPPTPRGTR